MPTYEYRCTKGHVFEEFQRISERPLRKCPEHKTKVVRLIGSGLPPVFIGPGFHATDYPKF